MRGMPSEWVVSCHHRREDLPDEFGVLDVVLLYASGLAH